MGLDITAKSDVFLAGFYEEYNDDWEDSGLYINSINPDFPHAVPAEFVGHKYALFLGTIKTRSHSFRAGSYGGYGQFRRSLGLGIAAEAIWADPESFKHTPFAEMINFSDCEGIMAGTVCEKLYKDFVDNHDRYVDYVLTVLEGAQSLYIGKYVDWTEAFRLASQDGYVSFH